MVANSLYEGPREGVRRQVFIPNWGNERRGVLRADRRSASGSAYSARSATQVRQLDASMPVYAMKTLEAQLDETLLTDRLIALLSAGFGLLATVLASIGLYGVMAFVVARRRKELGIRLALGARARRRDLAGDARGAAAARDRSGDRHPGGDGARAGSSSSQLYGIQAHDPWTATATLMLLTLVSAAAGLIPAHRASRIDPILALRYE